MYSYDKQAKKSRVACNSTVLCETLGNIRYLFTDKTGTLTKNELILRELIVGGEEYEFEMYLIVV